MNISKLIIFKKSILREKLQFYVRLRGLHRKLRFISKRKKKEAVLFHVEHPERIQLF